MTCLKEAMHGMIKVDIIIGSAQLVDGLSEAILMRGSSRRTFALEKYGLSAALLFRWRSCDFVDRVDSVTIPGCE